MPIVGLSALFLADALRLSEEHGVTAKVANFWRSPAHGDQWQIGGALVSLIQIAVHAQELRERNTIITPNMFAALYRSEPDFVLALLELVRKKWKQLDKSKRGKTIKALGTNVSFTPGDTQGKSVDQWSLADCQLAQAIGVETGDVEKARQELVRRIQRAQRLANRLAERNQKLFEKSVGLKK